jgi:hypothetical protein
MSMMSDIDIERQEFEEKLEVLRSQYMQKRMTIEQEYSHKRYLLRWEENAQIEALQRSCGHPLLGEDWNCVVCGRYKPSNGMDHVRWS